MNTKIRAVRQGRQIFWITLPLMLAVPFVNIWQAWLHDTPAWLLQSGLVDLHFIGIIGSLVALFLWGLSYHGYRAARIAMSLGYFLAGIFAMGLLGWLTISLSTLPANMVLIAAAVSAVYAVMGLVLLLAPQVKAFERHRRQRRAGNRYPLHHYS